MLILTRRVGESLVVGRRITISVLGVKGNQIRLGIEAPRDVPVHREEVAERSRYDTSTTGCEDEAAEATPLDAPSG